MRIAPDGRTTQRNPPRLSALSLQFTLPRRQAKAREVAAKMLRTAFFLTA